MTATSTPHIVLRPYQTKTLTSLFEWLSTHKGNPCVMLPTGAGKSIVIAEFCRLSLEWWPETKILVLTHQKELIEQDADKLKKIWPSAPIGIYAASLKKKDLSKPVTFASIQSIGRKETPSYDIVLVDEAHLINAKQQGLYRSFLSRLGTRVIGFTATPYRLGQGLLTEGEDALFEDIIQEVSVLDLQHMGYLAMLRSKHTFNRIDVSDVTKRGGEYVESELNQKMQCYRTNDAMAEEITKFASHFSRHHILVFCSGIEHAKNIAALLEGFGMPSAYITGSMGMKERERVIDDFKSGRITALTNANVLTTGFDYPDIDMIAMLRPTLSPVLYVQMVGRGLRLKSNGGDCLVLDFAGNVETHGPIGYVQPPVARTGKGNGVAPCKMCPNCLEIVHASVMVCPACGYTFERAEKVFHLFDGDINGDGLKRWTPMCQIWSKVNARTSGKPMITCTYMVKESNYEDITEYYCVYHENRFGHEAIRRLQSLCSKVGITWSDNMDELLEELKKSPIPSLIFTAKDGRFKKVAYKLWPEDIDALIEAQSKEKRNLDEIKSRIYS